MPLMVTGGFRTRAGMEDALVGPSPEPRPGTAESGTGGDCDVVGLGRPLCWQPDFPRRLLAREVPGIENLDARLRIRERGWLSPTSPFVVAKVLNTFGAQAWYYCQLFRLADGRPADLKLGVGAALFEYLSDEMRAARRMHRAYRR